MAGATTYPGPLDVPMAWGEPFATYVKNDRGTVVSAQQNAAQPIRDYVATGFEHRLQRRKIEAQLLADETIYPESDAGQTALWRTKALVESLRMREENARVQLSNYEADERYFQRHPHYYAGPGRAYQILSDSVRRDNGYLTEEHLKAAGLPRVRVYRKPLLEALRALPGFNPRSLRTTNGQIRFAVTDWSVRLPFNHLSSGGRVHNVEVPIPILRFVWQIPFASFEPTYTLAEQYMNPTRGLTLASFTLATRVGTGSVRMTTGFKQLLQIQDAIAAGTYASVGENFEQIFRKQIPRFFAGATGVGTNLLTSQMTNRLFPLRQHARPRTSYEIMFPRESRNYILEFGPHAWHTNGMALSGHIRRTNQDGYVLHPTTFPYDVYERKVGESTLTGERADVPTLELLVQLQGQRMPSHLPGVNYALIRIERQQDRWVPRGGLFTPGTNQFEGVLA